MKLKDITCDLKYAKTLKALGVDQTSSFAVFYGCNLVGPTPFKDANQDLCGTLSNRNDKKTQDYFVSTFTTEELLNILPKEIKHNFNEHSSYYLCMGYDGENGLPMAWYEDNDLCGKDEMLVSEADVKLSNALAKVLIWLLKNNKIDGYKKEEKQKKISLKSQEPPKEKVIYKAMPKRFYGYENKCWILRSKPVLEGSFYVCTFTKEITGEKIEELADKTSAKLSARVLDFINNRNFF